MATYKEYQGLQKVFEGESLNRSLQFLEALGKAGLVVCPKTPSKEMLAAGSKAGDIGAKAALKVYEAMIDAAR